MDRRKFLKSFLVAAPAIAIPSVAVSVTALDESRKTAAKVNNLTMNFSQEGASFNNCQFDISGGMNLYGDYQTINGANFTMYGADCAIKIDRS